MGATIQVRGSVGARDSLDLELYNMKPDLRRSKAEVDVVAGQMRNQPVRGRRRAG
jgi:hypothetical protein